jgi:hypothetical protein
MNRAPTVLAALAAAGAAHAQSFTLDSTVTFSLRWDELDAAYQPVPNPDGVLEPGERALLRLDVGFTNQNTVAQFAPPIGTYGSGTIRGFGVGWLDLIGSNRAEGDWNVDFAHGFGVNPKFSNEYNGTPLNSGATLSDIQMLQLLTAAPVITANPVLNIWTGVWTPREFDQRTVDFRVSTNPKSNGLAGGVFVRLSPTIYVSVWCPFEAGSVSISLAPAPGVLPLLLFGAGAAATYRRRPP